MRSETPTLLIIFLVLWMAAPPKSAADDSRFVGLDSQGRRVAALTASNTWACVLDQQTGLIWESRTRDGGVHDYRHTYTWRDTPSTGSVTQCSDGGSHCNTDDYVAKLNELSWCGFADWRLPAREELRSLVEYDRPYPTPMIDLAYFPHTAAQFYWAAEADASDGNQAWGIGFVYGFDYTYRRDNAAHLRLVYGLDPPPGAARSIARVEGTLDDARTGLTWQRCAVGQEYVGARCTGTARALSWKEASDPQLLGAEWRLPTLKELASIVDLSRSHPAIAMDLFPQTPAADFWTSTPFFGNAALSWLVNFSYGEGYAGDGAGRAYVRAVRDLRGD